MAFWLHLQTSEGCSYTLRTVTNCPVPSIRYILLCLAGLSAWFVTPIAAQSHDSAKSVPVNITSDFIIHTKTDTAEYNRFVGNAVFIQESDTLTCDSLVQNTLTKNIEAYSNVKIRQTDGTQAQSDFLRYTSSARLAYLHDNVVLTDGRNRLTTRDLTYDLGTKTGVYTNGGRLTTDSTIVTSTNGEYHVNTKDARFKEKVVVNDVRYKIVSDDLGYNTGTRLVTFYAPSVVTSDSGKSVLRTSNGTYESGTGTAHFFGRSSVFNEDHYLEGDTIFYNKATGYGFADGKVITIDTGHHSKLYCGHLEYFKFRRVMWATGKPVLEQVNGKDTIYIRADTFYSFPTARLPLDTAKKGRKGKFNDTLAGKGAVVTDTAHHAGDTVKTVMVNAAIQNDNGATAGANDAAPFSAQGLKIVLPDSVHSDSPAAVHPTPPPPTSKKSAPPTAGKGGKKTAKGSKLTLPKVVKKDTTAADTTAPLVFVGYHHVKIFSDSLQGLCDSISYSRADSTIRMIYSPIAWSHLSQITGDTILLHLSDSGKLKSMYVPNNAFVVSQTGPEKAHMFDQVQGKTITGYFEKNTITQLVVVPDAQSIYYSKDSKGAYIGESEASSELMKVFFEQQQVYRIIFERDITQTLTPMDQVDIPGAHLSRFQWLMDTRPKAKAELFE